MNIIARMTTKFQESKFFQAINFLMKNRYFHQGLPLLVLVTGGSFALTIVQKIKIDYQRDKQVIEHMKLTKFDEKLKPVSLEEEYMKLQQVDNSSYENVRGPRPYEDNSEWAAKKPLQEKRFEEMLEKMKKLN